MKAIQKIKNSSEWHEWFAWHPVWYLKDNSRVWVWLEKLERKEYVRWLSTDVRMAWAYRELTQTNEVKDDS